MDLTFTVGDYDRVRPLRTGEVSPEGIDLTVEHRHPGQTFVDVSAEAPFDVTEMSLSTYTLWTSRGTCPHVGIPAFPSRFFRHGNVFVNAAAGVDEPADLRGAKVGIYTEYQMTMATTVRGMLQHEYDVHPSEVTWYTAREEKMEIELPADVEKHVVGDDEDLHEMLADGALDALVTPRIPEAFGEGVDRLFPDFKAVERDYFARTGIFPIMHTVIIHGDVYAESPWVAEALFEALTEAKALTIERLYDPAVLRVTLPWAVDHVEEAREALGEDYWPYGFAANRAALEALTRYSHEQQLSERRVEPTELFVDELLGT